MSKQPLKDVVSMLIRDKDITILQTVVNKTHYMALASGRYNARSDWLIVTEL